MNSLGPINKNAVANASPSNTIAVSAEFLKSRLTASLPLQRFYAGWQKVNNSSLLIACHARPTRDLLERPCAAQAPTRLPFDRANLDAGRFDCWFDHLEFPDSLLSMYQYCEIMHPAKVLQLPALMFAGIR